MRICVVTPAPPSSRRGNRVTALRWARLLRELGHDVDVAEGYERQRCDVLVALHARHSAEAVVRFRERHPERPIVLALTGTDVYRDIHVDELARQALGLATRYVVLQRLAADELPEDLREQVHVIYQSALAPTRRPASRDDLFEVALLAHLRPVKDPLLAGVAARNLPDESRVRVVHAGAALDPELGRRAEQESRSNPRYEWVGEVPRGQALQLLARSRLMVLTSAAEGGANVVSEALAARVPVISSRIPGSLGILGEDYRGYFTPGDADELAVLLRRAETEPEFYEALRLACECLAPLVTPERERASWQELLHSLAGQS